jgi:hypothetical protein
MFDNLEENKNAANPSPFQPVKSAQSPAAPMAKPDDIFAGVKDVAAPKPPAGSPVTKPLQAANHPQNGSNGLFKVLIAIIILLVLIIGTLIVASQYFGFRGLSQFLPGQKEVVLPEKDDVAAEALPEVKVDSTDKNQASGSLENKEEVKDIPATPAGLPEEVVATGSVAEAPLAPAKIDSDQDGLFDDEEIALGTDKNKADTDGDALADGEEINLYKTSPLKIDTDNDELSDFEEINKYFSNPNNPDTDADGYSDGQEVKGGYNPKGSGKLPGAV